MSRSSVPFLRKTSAYFWTLPRWFALPGAIASVALGGVLIGQSPGIIALASLAGALIVAYAHSYNSWADWQSGLDQGPESERSHEKPYTGGQNLIAAGVITVEQARDTALFYLALSALATVALGFLTTLWVWLPWGLVAACAPLYSWGKFNFTCELWLGLGFGPLAVLFGAAVDPSPEMAKAFLAGIPFGIVFGYMAELVDQYLDADVNVPKGLRNLGALCWQRHWGLAPIFALMAAITVAVQFGLIATHTLSGGTVIALIPLLFLVLLAPMYEKKRQGFTMAGLGLVMLYPLAILVVEAVT